LAIEVLGDYAFIRTKIMLNIYVTPHGFPTGSGEEPRLSGVHQALGTTILPPYSNDLEVLVLGMGCFWGVERKFWSQKGIFTTAVGYAGGMTENPSYGEVCSGTTGHSEVVLVVYSPEQCSHESLLSVFWEGHDPTQGMRQGNDRGSQYRSAIYCNSDKQLETAMASVKSYQGSLHLGGLSAITTEIKIEKKFYFAEEYHQQYLHRNPNGYCAMQGTGVRYLNV
jgi:peptide-methionine (S)-S-oxide reductase